MLRNRAAFPLSWLGIVKAGAVMVPLNVFYKTTDAGYLLEHAGVSRIICEPDLSALIAESSPRLREQSAVITVNQQGVFDALPRATSPEAPAVSVTPESLANVQYTSGTTGRPKGCMLSHSYFLRFG